VKQINATVLSGAAAAFLAAAVFAAPESKPMASVENAPVDYPAITYYNERCARCHGPDGVNYDLKHLAQLPAEKLHQVIETMAENQGQAPLDKQQVEIQRAYHRSFLDGKPFVILNSAQNDGAKLLLRGEATPESQVQICVGEKFYEANVEEQSWTVEIPAAPLTEVLIVVTKDKAMTKLNAGEGFSHQS